MKNWIGGFITAALVIGIGLQQNVIVTLVKENKELKSQLESKKEEEE